MKGGESGGGRRVANGKDADMHGQKAALSGCYLGSIDLQKRCFIQILSFRLSKYGVLMSEKVDKAFYQED